MMADGRCPPPPCIVERREPDRLTEEESDEQNMRFPLATCNDLELERISMSERARRAQHPRSVRFSRRRGDPIRQDWLQICPRPRMTTTNDESGRLGSIYIDPLVRASRQPEHPRVYSPAPVWTQAPPPPPSGYRPFDPTDDEGLVWEPPPSWQPPESLVRHFTPPQPPCPPATQTAQTTPIIHPRIASLRSSRRSPYVSSRTPRSPLGPSPLAREPSAKERPKRSPVPEGREGVPRDLWNILPPRPPAEVCMPYRETVEKRNARQAQAMREKLRRQKVDEMERRLQEDTDRAGGLIPELNYHRTRGFTNYSRNVASPAFTTPFVSRPPLSPPRSTILDTPADCNAQPMIPFQAANDGVHSSDLARQVDVGFYGGMGDLIGLEEIPPNTPPQMALAPVPRASPASPPDPFDTSNFSPAWGRRNIQDSGDTECRGYEFGTSLTPSRVPSPRKTFPAMLPWCGPSPAAVPFPSARKSPPEFYSPSEVLIGLEPDEDRRPSCPEDCEDCLYQRHHPAQDSWAPFPSPASPPRVPTPPQCTPTRPRYGDIGEMVAQVPGMRESFLDRPVPPPSRPPGVFTRVNCAKKREVGERRRQAREARAADSPSEWDFSENLDTMYGGQWMHPLGHPIWSPPVRTPLGKNHRRGKGMYPWQWGLWDTEWMEKYPIGWRDTKKQRMDWNVSMDDDGRCSIEAVNRPVNPLETLWEMRPPTRLSNIHGLVYDYPSTYDYPIGPEECPWASDLAPGSRREALESLPMLAEEECPWEEDPMLRDIVGLEASPPPRLTYPITPQSVAGLTPTQFKAEMIRRGEEALEAEYEERCRTGGRLSRRAMEMAMVGELALRQEEDAPRSCPMPQIPRASHGLIGRTPTTKTRRLPAPPPSFQKKPNIDQLQPGQRGNKPVDDIKCSAGGGQRRSEEQKKLAALRERRQKEKEFSAQLRAQRGRGRGRGGARC